MKLLLLLLYIINISNAFSVSFPILRKNKAVISNIRVNKLTSEDKKELKHLFNIVPLLVFKNQKINPSEYYEFVKLFDEKHKEDILHPWYTGIPNVPQVSIRGNMYVKDYYGVKNKFVGDERNRLNYFRYNYVWHQDLLGHQKYITPVVSSMYKLVTPKKEKIKTYYSSLEDAYDMMDMTLKKVLNSYNTIHSDSFERRTNSTYDYSGYVRKDKQIIYSDDNVFTEDPLVIYSDNTKYRKSLLLNPTRFLTFDKLNFYDSNELFRHIMKRYVLSRENMFYHEWDKNDLVIWNNRKLIHSSMPSEEYNSKVIPDNRLFIQCFLATNEPIYPAGSINSKPIYTPNIVDIGKLK